MIEMHGENWDYIYVMLCMGRTAWDTTSHFSPKCPTSPRRPKCSTSSYRPTGYSLCKCVHKLYLYFRPI